MPGHISGVSGNLVGQYTLFDVFGVRQSEMLLWRDITQHRGAVPTDHGRADRAGDVVITRSNVDYERPERIERRFVTYFHLFFDLEFNLVHGNVAGAFNHHLNIMFPGLLRQIAQHLQFSKLSGVAGVADRAGPQAVAQRKADIMFLENFADIVKALAQEVFFFVRGHPLSHQRAAAADDPRDAVAHQRQEFAHDAGVDGHVIDALLGLFFDYLEHEIGR